MIKTTNYNDVMEFIKEGIVSFNATSPVDCYIDNTEANGIINQMMSELDIEAGVTLELLSFELVKRLTNHAQKKMGVDKMELPVDIIIKDGTLRSIADGAIDMGNMKMCQAGHKPIFNKEDFYQKLKAKVEAYPEPVIEATELNTMAMDLICETADNLIASNIGYIS